MYFEMYAANGRSTAVAIKATSINNKVVQLASLGPAKAKACSPQSGPLRHGRQGISEPTTDDRRFEIARHGPPLINDKTSSK